MSEVFERVAVETVPLGELLIDIRNGLVVEQEKESPGIPITRIETISKGTVDMDRVRYVRDAAGKNLENFWLKKGDILFSHINSDLHLGKTALVLSDAPLLHGMNLLRLRVDSSRLRPKYLHHWLDYCRRTGVFMAIAQHAVNQSSLNQKKITSLEVPLCSIEQQDEIVAEIEKQFSRLDEAVANLQRVKANLKRYKASALKAAVEGRLVETEGGWRPSTLGQEGAIIGGLTKNQKRNDLPLKLPYLRVANVYANQLRLDDIEYIGVAEKELEKLLVRKGDLLVVEGNGSPDQIGRVALWNDAIPNCVHQNHLIKVRLGQAVMPEWALIWMLSPVGRHAIEQVSASTSGLHTLSVGKVSMLPIGVPPIKEQMRIVAKLDQLLSVQKSVETEVDANLQRAHALRASVLSGAFEPVHRP